MAARYRLRQSGLDWVESSSETVIVDDASEQYLATNAAGGLLWSALKEDQTADQLAALLVDEYGIDQTQASADVEAYLEQLSELDLLEITD